MIIDENNDIYMAVDMDMNIYMDMNMGIDTDTGTGTDTDTDTEWQTKKDDVKTVRVLYRDVHNC